MKARAVKGLDPTTPLRPNAALVIRSRLEELRALEDRALEPDATEAQHDLRIAAKRLRYALEVAGPCFGSEAEAARKVARELQSVLGELRDCDQLLSRGEGADSLASFLPTRREVLFARFRELWRSAESSAAFSGLERLL